MVDTGQFDAERPAELADCAGEDDRPPAMVDLDNVKSVIVSKSLQALHILRIGPVLDGKMLAADMVQALSAEMRKAERLR